MGRWERAEKAEVSRTPEEAFGFTLRRIRLKRGLSQQLLADRSGYDRTYIGLLERGQKAPSLRAIFNIATTLQVKPSEILAKVQRVVGRAGKINHAG
jgi:transcriptional regulator with XRE-family HTH domain